MEDSEFITIVTSEAAILRQLNGISEQNTTLTIVSGAAGKTRVYRSSIQSVEAENNYLILRQLVPGDWRDFIETTNDIEVTCRMPSGTIKFLGSLSPLDGSDDGMYCRLTFPEQLSKRQRRAYFRISLRKFKSRVSIEFVQGSRVTGSCKNISHGGALFYLPTGNSQIKQGQLAEQCKLVIADTFDLCCAAEICHVKSTETNGLLVGVNFVDLDPSQQRAIKSTINKLERLNITK